MRIWIPKDLNVEQIVLTKPFGRLNVSVISGDKQYIIEEHQDFYSVSECLIE